MDAINYQRKLPHPVTIFPSTSMQFCNRPGVTKCWMKEHALEWHSMLLVKLNIHGLTKKRLACKDRLSHKISCAKRQGHFAHFFLNVVMLGHEQQPRLQAKHFLSFISLYKDFVYTRHDMLAYYGGRRLFKNCQNLFLGGTGDTKRQRQIGKLIKSKKRWENPHVTDTNNIDIGEEENEMKNTCRRRQIQENYQFSIPFLLLTLIRPAELGNLCK